MVDRQHLSPIYDALNEVAQNKIVPFDVPGHKRGRLNYELNKYLGNRCMSLDANSMKSLDNLCHPVSVIKEAEELAAEAFNASHAFFMVNGTTSAVQAMVMTACNRDEKIILPRNVHQSVINAIIITGAIPVYINPEINSSLGIPLGMSFENIEKAIIENPDAKAVILNNPTYYGICSNIKAITELAHKYNMLVLVDEAHGAHFYFGKDCPLSAMKAGADMSAVSMHKSGGSLTQSSFLLIGSKVSVGKTRQIINLTQTTSGSYLLLSSLDLARRFMALQGEKLIGNVCRLTQYARDEINGIGKYYAFSRELINNDSVFDFDITKLSIHTLELGLSGIEVYDILRDEYDIQVEYGDIGNLLAYVSVGNSKEDIDQLINAFATIACRYQRSKTGMLSQEYISPEIVVMPQQAFYAKKKSIPISESANQICCESITCYPPGIPILAPGERITKDIISYIFYAKEKGCLLTGLEDMRIEYINVLKAK